MKGWEPTDPYPNYQEILWVGSSVPRSEGNTIADFLGALILELEKWLSE